MSSAVETYAGVDEQCPWTPATKHLGYVPIRPARSRNSSTCEQQHGPRRCGRCCSYRRPPDKNPHSRDFISSSSRGLASAATSLPRADSCTNDATTSKLNGNSQHRPSTQDELSASVDFSETPTHLVEHSEIHTQEDPSSRFAVAVVVALVHASADVYARTGCFAVAHANGCAKRLRSTHANSTNHVASTAAVPASRRNIA
jgi:hypothetical protein